MTLANNIILIKLQTSRENSLINMKHSNILVAASLMIQAGSLLLT